MKQDTVEKDFVLDTVGDVEGDTQGSNRGEGGEQHVSPEQWLGEPDYLGLEKEQVARGFLAFLAQMFEPKPTGVAAMDLTPDDAFAAQETMQQVKDALRYLGTSSIKVTDTPARRQKLYTVVVKTDATRVAGFQANRKKLIIRNLDTTNAVYIGEDGASLNTDVAYELRPNDENGSVVEINAQGEIWALSANGGEKLNVQAEYYD